MILHVEFSLGDKVYYVKTKPTYSKQCSECGSLKGVFFTYSVEQGHVDWIDISQDKDGVVVCYRLTSQFGREEYVDEEEAFRTEEEALEKLKSLEKEKE